MAINTYKRLIVGSFFLKLAGAGLGLAVYGYLAHLLTVPEFGLFALCMSLILLTAGMAKQGVEHLLVRFIAVVGPNNHASLYGLCLLVVVVLGTGLAVLITWFATTLSTWLGSTDINTLLPLVGLLALCNSVQAVNTAFLNALHKPKLNVLFSGIVSQLLFLVLLFASAVSTPYQALILLLFCQAISLALSFIVTGYFCLPSLRGITALPLRCLGVANAHYFIIALLMLITQQVPQVIVAKYASLDEVAFLALAIKIAAFFAYPLMAVNKVCGPHYSRLYSVHNITGLINLAKITRRQLTLIATVGLALVFLLVEPFLLVLDSSYLPAAYYIKILALGQWVNLATGSAVLILLMTGYERLHLYQNLAVTSLYFCALLVCVPYLGASAAVILMALAMALKNILSFQSVKKIMIKKN